MAAAGIAMLLATLTMLPSHAGIASAGCTTPTPTVGGRNLPYKVYAVNVGSDSASGSSTPAQPTLTPTPVPCATSGPSGSATSTATATAVSTNTPVPTGTGTTTVPTSTPTQVVTPQPTVSATASSSPTATNTAVPTSTPTPTSTPQPTPTAMATPSPTPSPTPTVVPCTPGGQLITDFFLVGEPATLPIPGPLTVSSWNWCPGSTVTASIPLTSSPTPIQWVAFTFFFDPGGPSDGHVEKIITVPVSGTTSNGTWSVTVTMPIDATIVHTHRIDVTVQNGSTDTFGGNPPGRVVLTYSENH